MGFYINIVLHIYFDLLKPKSTNIPGELYETTIGYNQQGQEPQETTVDTDCCLASCRKVEQDIRFWSREYCWGKWGHNFLE